MFKVKCLSTLLNWLKTYQRAVSLKNSEELHVISLHVWINNEIICKKLVENATKLYKDVLGAKVSEPQVRHSIE